MWIIYKTDKGLIAAKTFKRKGEIVRGVLIHPSIPPVPESGEIKGILINCISLSNFRKLLKKEGGYENNSS